MTLESRIERSIKTEAELLGISCHKWKGANENGLPDKLMIIPSRTTWFKLPYFFCIEVKKPGGVLGPYQLNKIRKLRTLGVRVYVVDNVEEGINAIKTELARVSERRS